MIIDTPVTVNASIACQSAVQTVVTRRKLTEITRDVTTLLTTLITAIVLMFSVLQPAQAAKLSDYFTSSKSSQQKFLSVNDAFQVTPNIERISDGSFVVRFDITDGHYVYRDKLTLKLPEGVTASAFSFNKKPSFVNDPSFGEVAVFEQQTVVATVKLANTTAADLVNMPITLKWQGCAKAGLCYPPEKIKVSVDLKKKR